MALLLTPAPAQATYAGVNGRIAFAANLGSPGKWKVYTMRADGTAVKRLTTVPDPGWNYPNPDWSPDGGQVILISPSASPNCCHTQVFRINADGSGLVQLTHSTNRDNDFASWSPDGSKILVSRSGALEHAIWVMNADGTGFKRLTSELYDNNDPEFTPDGEHIVFDSQKGGLVSAIWIMNADGSNQRRLTPAKLEAGLPDVSPDGQHIVFINHFGTPKPTAVFSMNMDGGAITKLTVSGCCHHDSMPNFAPDGTKIVFTTDRNYPALDGTDIYEMNADGSNQQQITTNLTLGGCPDDFQCVFPDWGPRP